MRDGLPILLLLLLLALALSTVGCGTEIGDDCDSNYECSTAGGVCDTTAPDGYCLKEGCWTDGDCPDKGVCVCFPNGDRYCMRECSSNDDCRDEYSCIRLAGQPRFCYVK